MSLSSEHLNLSELDERLCSAPVLTVELLSEVVGSVCTRLSLLRNTERAARAEQMIRSGAWTDAALALLALELPQWQLRRLIYDDSDWSDEEMGLQLARSAKENGWDEPEMDAYDRYDEERRKR